MRASFSRISTFTNSRADFGSERLTLVVGDANGGALVELEGEGNRRASLDFDLAALERLHRLLDAFLSPVGSAGHSSESFAVDGGNRLVVTRKNWGDPYDEGASFNLVGTAPWQSDDDALEVRLTDDELRPLSRRLAELLRRPAAEKPPAASR